MTEATRTFFRIVRGSMASSDDFRSAAAMGLPRAGQLEDGISVFATEAQARAKARQYRLLGDHIAQLEYRRLSSSSAPFRAAAGITRCGDHPRRCSAASSRFVRSEPPSYTDRMRATKRAIDSKMGRPISKASYELWDLTSGNIIGGYGTEAAALEACAIFFGGSDPRWQSD